MAEWSHLPNARHIDAVLAHVRQHPDRWVAAWDAAWAAARDAARDAAWGAAWDAAWDACTALTAWDDCAYILDMPADAVRLLAGVGNHAAILLLPTVLAMNGEHHGTDS